MNLKNMYIIGQKEKISDENFINIENHINYSLPNDYKEFIYQYGYGNLNELLLMEKPDKDVFRNTFADDLDLWDWEKPLQEKALQGVLMAQSVDGDIVLAINNEESPCLLLPRDSQFPKLFTYFQEVIQYYIEEYRLEKLYYDADYQSDFCFFNIEEEFSDIKLEKTAILYKKFKKNYDIQVIFGQENYQPKCVLQDIGGWVWFNLDTGEIRLKYQKIYYQKAKTVMDFFENQSNIKL